MLLWHIYQSVHCLVGRIVQLFSLDSIYDIKAKLTISQVWFFVAEEKEASP